MPEARAFPPGRWIWLYDRREYWRSHFGEALAASGCGVRSCAEYQVPPSDASPDEEPDLVVVGCAHVTEEERDLVWRCAQRRHHVLVLAASRDAATVRGLFLAGAFDVTRIPASADQFLTLIEQTLEKAERAREREVLLST